MPLQVGPSSWLVNELLVGGTNAGHLYSTGGQLFFEDAVTAPVSLNALSGGIVGSNTLDDAYNNVGGGGLPGSGRTILANAGAVQINKSSVDANAAFVVNVTAGTGPAMQKVGFESFLPPFAPPAVSAAGEARLYTDGLAMYLSVNGGAYAPIAAGGGAPSLEDAYNTAPLGLPLTGLGRTILANAGALVINKSSVDANNAFEVNVTGGTGLAICALAGNISCKNAGGASSERFGSGLALVAANTQTTVVGVPGAIFAGPNITTVGAVLSSLGSNCVVIGTTAQAGQQSIAIGCFASVAAIGSVGIGDNVAANFADCVAIGRASVCGNISSIAIGRSASANIQSISVGMNATATGQNSTVVGYQANAAGGNNGTALGFQAQATAAGVVSVGFQAGGAGLNAISIGQTSAATGTGDIAIGSASIATSLTSGCIAIGQSASAAGGADHSIALGDSAVTTEVESVIIGFNASATAASPRCNVIGSGAYTQTAASDANVMGTGAYVEAPSGIAIGTAAYVPAGANNSIAIGPSASAADVSCVAIGDSSNTGPGTPNSIAIGFNAAVAPAILGGVIAIGGGSIGGAPGATALGNVANASGLNSVSLGQSAATSGLAAVAVGSSAACAAAGGVAIGQTASVPGGLDTGGVAIGNASVARLLSVAIGDTATMTGATQGVAIGANSNAGAINATAVGFQALSTALGAISFGAGAASANLGGIAVGLGTTIAAGATGSDLYGPNLALAPGNTNCTIVGRTAVGLGAVSTDVVAIGANLTLGGNNSSAVVIGSGITGFGASGVVIGAAASISAIAGGCVVIGAGATSGGGGNVVLGQGAGVGLSGGNVCIGTGAASGNGSIGIGATCAVGGGPAGGIIGIGNTITCTASTIIGIGHSSTLAEPNTISIGSANLIAVGAARAIGIGHALAFGATNTNCIYIINSFNSLPPAGSASNVFLGGGVTLVGAGSNVVGIGQNLTVTGSAIVAIGESVSAQEPLGVVIGQGLTVGAGATRPIVIGTGTTALTAVQIDCTLIGHNISLTAIANTRVVGIGNAVAFGGAVDCIAIGHPAACGGSTSIAIGNGAACGIAGGSMAIGHGASATQASIAIGNSASAGGGPVGNSIAIGGGATATAANQFICGSAGFFVNTVRFVSNGAANLGTVYEWVGNGTAQAVSAAGECRVRYNSGTPSLEVSYNGAAYVVLGGGGGGAALNVCYGLGNTIAISAAARPVAISNAGAFASSLLTLAQNAGVATTTMTISGGTGLALDVSGGTGIRTTTGLTSTGAGAGSERLGSGATSAGASSTAIGNACSCAGIQAVAVGNACSNAATNAVGMGWACTITAGGTQSTMVGGGTTCTSSDGVGVGYGAAISNTNAVAVGVSSSVTAASGIAIGYAAVAGFSASIAIGRGATTTVGNQLVIGAATYNISSVHIGNGVSNAAPSGFILRSTAATGAANGASIQIQPGDAGAVANRSGSIVFRTRKGGTALGTFTNQIICSGDATNAWGRLALGENVTSEVLGSGVEIQGTSFGVNSVVTSAANPYVVTDTDFLVLYTTAGGAVTIPSAANRNGRILAICNRSGGVGVVVTPAAGTINGAANYTLNNVTDQRTILLVADAAATDWQIVAHA